MPLNSLTVKKFLLTAGILVVMGQGLWQLPELQDYLFPVENVEFILRQARKECPRIRDDLGTLNQRVDYLAWFQAHNGPNQGISADRLLSFPFSECIRPLAPNYFWKSNIRLAHQVRVKIERKLVYLDTLLKSIDRDSRGRHSYDSPVIPAKSTAIPDAIKQIQHFQDQYVHCNAKLEELTQQLNWLEKNGYNN